MFVPSEIVQRKVLLALEVVDAVTRQRLTHGLRVIAYGLAGQPIINLSDRFVWLQEGNSWPEEIRVDPQSLPFLPPLPLRPARPSGALPPCIPVILAPNAAYPFPDGVLALRGALKESAAPDAAVIHPARLELKWRYDEGEPWRSGSTSNTDLRGSFALFARTSGSSLRADGLVSVRIDVMRDSNTKTTGDGFAFFQEPYPKGCLRDARLHTRPVLLAWNTLAGA